MKEEKTIKELDKAWEEWLKIHPLEHPKIFSKRWLWMKGRYLGLW